KEKHCSQFQRFALVPDSLRSRINRWMLQALHQLLMLARKSLWMGHSAQVRISRDHRRHQRMQSIAMARKVSPDEFRGVLHCDELVMLATLAAAAQAGAPLPIKTRRMLPKLRFFLSHPNHASSSQVQANLNAF